MQTFKDAIGREWDVTVTVASLKRVKSLTSRLLTDLIDPNSETLKAAAADPFVLPDMLFALVKPQADAKQISDEQFFEAMGGDSLASATEKLMQAVIDFFQNPQQRELNRQILTKSQAAMSLMLGQATTSLKTVTAEQIALAMSLSSTSAISAPESSASPTMGT